MRKRTVLCVSLFFYINRFFIFLLINLLVRVINVLGKTLPINTFLETQQIESTGGMLIINGGRRRTPGGVFFYLIKNNPDIANSDKKDIFQEERKIALNEKKMEQALNRERKVEELKKTLNLNDLPPLVTRTEAAMSHLKPKSNSSKFSFFLVLILDDFF